MARALTRENEQVDVMAAAELDDLCGGIAFDDSASGFNAVLGQRLRPCQAAHHAGEQYRPGSIALICRRSTPA